MSTENEKIKSKIDGWVRSFMLFIALLWLMILPIGWFIYFFMK